MPPKHRILPRTPASHTPSRPNPLLFNAPTVESFLLAYGDVDPPLASTIRVLDEIVTDYIIESCHEAAAVAHHARRQKIKLDDFKFMLRRDTGKLGRVMEMLETDKELRKKRKAFDTDEGAVVRGQGTEGGGAEVEEREKEKRDEGEKRRKKKVKKGKGEEGGAAA